MTWKKAFYIPSTIVHLSCMFYLFKTFTCLRKSLEDTLPWKHTVVKIKGAHRLYLSDCTEKWLASSGWKGVGSPLPCDWFFLSLSLFRKPQFLSGIRLSWLALFSYSIFFLPLSLCVLGWASSSFVFVSLFEPQAVEWVHCKSQCLRSSQGDEWTLGASLAELRSAFWEEWLLGCQREAVATETWHRYVLM